MTDPSMRILGAIALLVVAAAPVRAAGPVDPANGERLAKRWCSGCHLVAPDQTRASADAPSFASLADAAHRDPDRVADLLARPGPSHSKMPDMTLSRLEVADIVGWIASLKP